MESELEGIPPCAKTLAGDYLKNRMLGLYRTIDYCRMEDDDDEDDNNDEDDDVENKVDNGDNQPLKLIYIM